MPPKRAASGSAGPASKRTETPTDVPPRSKRWSAVSASANADADYKTTWQNPDRWYAYVTICSPIRKEDEEDEEEDEDDDDDDDGDSKSNKKQKEDDEGHGDDDEAEDETRDGSSCGKKRCVCFKPALQNPDHPWLVSMAGYRKYQTQHIHLNLRDPDNFHMYTNNDHASYGCIEVVQNLFLDYVEAAERGWREQWAVCEGLGLWLLNPNSEIMMMADDGELVKATIRLAGRMFLDMLAQLDNRDLLGDVTDVKSLGTFMGLYIKLVPEMRQFGILESERGDKKIFEADHFDDVILSYANQRGVALQGPEDIDELTANLAGEVELPNKGKEDPWGWLAGLKEYKDRHGGNGGIDGIGGDALDITTWTSAERKKASFDNRDPLGKRDIAAIKEGMVMQLG